MLGACGDVACGSPLVGGGDEFVEFGLPEMAGGGEIHVFRLLNNGLLPPKFPHADSRIAQNLGLLRCLVQACVSLEPRGDSFRGSSFDIEPFAHLVIHRAH